MATVKEILDFLEAKQIQIKEDLRQDPLDFDLRSQLTLIEELIDFIQ